MGSFCKKKVALIGLFFLLDACALDAASNVITWRVIARFASRVARGGMGAETSKRRNVEKSKAGGWEQAVQGRHGPVKSILSSV